MHEEPYVYLDTHSQETVRRLLNLADPQAELLALLNEMKQQGLKVIGLEDSDGENSFPLAEIDPFTFLATFNRGITEDNRRQNWAFLKGKWSLSADVPSDFNGIPVVHNMQSWFFPYAGDREKDHVALLWELVRQGFDKPLEQIDGALFDRCLQLDLITIHNLTIGLFWINPDQFLPADKKTRGYGKANGVAAGPKDFSTYRQWVVQMSEKFGRDYPTLSHNAHVWFTQDDSVGKTGTKNKGPGKIGDGRATTRGEGVSYWWLNANPKIWNFEATPVGGTQTYTSHNEEGNKRQKCKFPGMDFRGSLETHCRGKTVAQSGRV